MLLLVHSTEGSSYVRSANYEIEKHQIQEADKDVFTITAAPNPFIDRLNLTFVSNKDREVKMQVFNSLGVPVKSATFFLAKGTETKNLFFSKNNQAGVYFFNFTSDDGIRKVYQLVHLP